MSVSWTSLAYATYATYTLLICCGCCTSWEAYGMSVSWTSLRALNEAAEPTTYNQDMTKNACLLSVQWMRLKLLVYETLR